ncbi:hypothetical protein JKF63_03456 [Porcisia hertigi]|uniref:Uncharacterized protein n=1 Tax=Porcisia hertigi TaxID=2761500 RepID=A0A836HZQ0_9TRYP|nr:hypothetical protein JKF63_03456 [Porcisia hertigi]
MSQLPPHDSHRLRRRPRLPSTGPQSTSSSVRPSSRWRTEALEGGPPTVSPPVSPPATPVVAATRDRCSSTPPPVGWQYPSCSRCLACGQLGCDSCSVKVDPAATRQRLENLRLNTLFERAKLARSTDELRNEEGRQRARLMGRYESWLESLHTLELMRRHTVRVVMQEAAYRLHIYKEEQERRATHAIAADQHLLLLALQSSEAATRYATLAREREGFSVLSRHYAYETQVVRLHKREFTTREALRFNESSQRHRLQAQEVEWRNLMRDHVTEQQRFCESCWGSREELCRQQLSGVESLAAQAAAHREVLRQQGQQRDTLFTLAEHVKRGVVVEEAATRLRVREEMMEEADYIEECHRIFERQQTTLCNTEASQRQGIREAAEHGYHVLFLDMRANEDAVFAAEEEKADHRHSALILALETLSSIQQEESKFFTALLRKERDEGASIRVGVAKKAEMRAALLHRCIQEKKDSVMAEESLAREAICKAAAISKVAVAKWIEAKAEARAELCACAKAAAESLAKEEQESRLSLLSLMAAQEGLVVRLCEAKRLARLAFVESEATPRGAICQEEQESWQQLCMAFARTGKAIEERLFKDYQARVKVTQNALEATEQLTREEAREWARLCYEEKEQHDRARDALHYRCQVELMYEETQHRAYLARDEVAARAELRTRMALFARYAAEAALSNLHTQLCEVIALEESARVCFYEHVGEWYDWAMHQQREEELQLIKALERRIQEELYSRHDHIKEDDRLYDTTESLVFACGGAEDSDRSTLGEGGAGLEVKYTPNLRRELVMQTLGNPACVSPLSTAAVDFLVAVIDHFGQRRDAAQERFAVAERNAREASKKVFQHERLLAAEKEKEKMYEMSTRRETEERERRINQETVDKTRSQQMIVAEKRRLADVQAELLQEQRKLDLLKRSMSKQ